MHYMEPRCSDQRSESAAWLLWTSQTREVKLKSMCVLEGLWVGLAPSPAWPIEIAGTETRHETRMANTDTSTAGEWAHTRRV